MYILSQRSNSEKYYFTSFIDTVQMVEINASGLNAKWVVPFLM